MLGLMAFLNHYAEILDGPQVYLLNQGLTKNNRSLIFKLGPSYNRHVNRGRFTRNSRAMCLF